MKYDFYLYHTPVVIQIIISSFILSKAYYKNILNIFLSLNEGIEDSETKTSEILLSLSEIIRFNFQSPNYIIEFQEELYYLDLYMKLQNLRYHNKFEFICNVPNNLRKQPVLKFMLQPLIENSIKHGILKKDHLKGKIELEAYKHNDFLCISLSDNGVGIPQDKLENLRKSFDSNDVKNNYVGISNVYNRIKLLFGDKYGMEIYSDEKGTKIILILPFKDNF